MTQTSLPNAVHFTQRLLQLATVTPQGGPALDYITDAFAPLKPTCLRQTFSQEGTPDVDNLLLSIGTGAPHFCFSGHVDVVPVGEGWTHDPFGGQMVGQHLYGRGACDMKGAIGAFMAAVLHFKNKNPSSPGTISLLLTSDEEGPALNGTTKMLPLMAERGLIPDVCLVGEPTSQTHLGDMVKIGRRGSLCLKLTILGTAGHVAYPHLASNPIGPLARAIAALSILKLDEGTLGFDPSTLAFSSIQCPNQATNVIPGQASVNFNIRFNPLHSCDSLYEQIHAVIQAALPDQNFVLDLLSQAVPFLTDFSPLVDLVCQSITHVTGRIPTRSTSGGTSDARFIQAFCPVVEFGLLNATIHQANEVVDVADLVTLQAIYEECLKKTLEKPAL